MSLDRSGTHLVDFEVNLNEWEATSQGLGRPSIHPVDFEVSLKKMKPLHRVLDDLGPTWSTSHDD